MEVLDMFKLMMAGLVIAACVAAYKLWKAGKTVTTRTVVEGTKTEVKDAAVKAKPALMQLIMKFFTKK
jgi:hypothetical protein